MELDLKIVEAVQKISTEFLDWFFSALTKFGEEIFFVCIFLIFYWCVSYSHAFKFAFYYLISVLFNSVLKLIVNRPRPWMASSTIENKLPATGLSFPSGHSQSVSAISTFVVSDVFASNKSSKKIKIVSVAIAVFLCLIVGFTRIYLGQHYLTDVLVGLLVGCGVVLLLEFISSKIPNNIKQKIKLDYVLGAVLLLALILLLVVGFCKLGLSHTKVLKVFTYAGMAIGGIMGYFLSDRYVLNVELTKMQKLIKVAVGFIVTFTVYLLLCLIPVAIPFMAAFNVVVSAIVATFIYPLVFNKIISRKKKD